MRLLKKMEKKLNNKGLSLVELICAMAIMTIVGAAAAGLIVVTSGTYTRGSIDIELQEEAQLLCNQVTRLVQFSSDAKLGVSPSILIVSKGDSTPPQEYQLFLDASDNVVYYKEISTGDQAPMASNVESLSFDVSDFKNKGVVQMKVKLSKNGSSYEGSYTISSRNIDHKNDVSPGEVTMSYTDVYIVEPNSIQPLTAQMSDGSPVTWAMAGNTDTNTVLGYDGLSGKRTINIGKDEKADTITLYVRSQTKRSDGITPLIEKEVTVLVRRVRDLTLEAKNDATGDETKSITSGSSYTLKAFATGSHLENIGSATQKDPGYDTQSDGTPGLYTTLKPEDIAWELKVIIAGVTKYEIPIKSGYSDSYVECSAVDSAITGATPNFHIKLKFDMNSGDQIVVKATAKHPAGKIVRTIAGVEETENTNLYALPYDSLVQTWVLYKDVYSYNGTGFARGSDTKQGDVYVSNIINILVAKYGQSKVDEERWNSESILRSHRFREVIKDENGIVSYGPWTNWRYLGTSSQQDHGNDLNIRPDATMSLECDKTYQVQLRLFVLGKDGKEYYPIKNETPESEYIITGLINPVVFKMRATYNDGTNLFYNEDSAFVSVEPGKTFYFEQTEVQYIKGDTNQRYLYFHLQKQDKDGSWNDVSIYEDFNNMTANGAYVRKNQGNITRIEQIELHRKGTYRICMNHVKVPYTKYIPATDTYEKALVVENGATTDATRDYEYCDMSIGGGKGFFYFYVGDNSTKWKQNYVEVGDEIKSAKDYFVCNGKFYERSTYNCWSDGDKRLYYKDELGKLYFSADNIDYEEHSYSYVNGNDKSVTIDGKTYKTKDDVKKLKLDELIIKFLCDKLP